MFVSNLPGSLQGAWGNAPFLQVNSPKIGILGQNTPAQDVLGRMSENLMDVRQQTSLQDFWTRSILPCRRFQPRL